MTNYKTMQGEGIMLQIVESSLGRIFHASQGRKNHPIRTRKKPVKNKMVDTFANCEKNKH